MKKRRSKRAVAAALLCLLLVPGKTLAADACFFPACDRDCPSLVDALDGLGADSSFEGRREIAYANGYRDYRGTAGQNTALLHLLRHGLLRRPEKTGGPLNANRDRVRFLRQEPKTCKASALAMALNLLLGSDEFTTGSMGGDCCRSIAGERFAGSDGHTYTGVYRTDAYEGSLDELTEGIDGALADGVPIVAAVHSIRGGTQHHWVLILGRSGEDYLIADPAQAFSGSIEDSAVTMASRGYALGLADYDTMHYGYVTFQR
jgi:hypothetical protein